VIPGFDHADLVLLEATVQSYERTNFDSDRAHALVIDEPADIVFAFQGTEPERLIDLYTDADAATVDMPGLGPMDEGFCHSLCSLAWRLVPIALAARARGAKIRITGHSKGGAEGAGFAAMLVLLDCAVERLTLWEPARALGPQALALIAGIPGIATRNGSDPIPALPPWFGQRPLVQLGEASEIPSLAAHKIAAVRAAFLAELGTDVALPE
jgi:hypothetical protein